MTVAESFPETRPGAASPDSAPGWRPLAGLMLGGGVLHLAMPGPFESMVPTMFGDPKPLVFWSGIIEIGCGVGLAIPRSRRLAGLATAALLVGVYPANVDMTVRAFRSSRASAIWKAGLVARLPLQAPPIIQALKLARTPRAERSARAGARA